MKKMQKKIIEVFCISSFLTGIIFSGSVWAADLNVDLSDEYKKWNNLILEEREETIMPKTYSTNVPEIFLEEAKRKEIPSLVNKITENLKSKDKNFSLQNVKLSYEEKKYDLRNILNLRVEHQGFTSECWAFSMLKSFETNIALRKGTKELENFSERHMDYATSKTFLDGINENGFSREVGSGGLPISAIAYLTNGQGAVLESEMPFENNEERIYLENINKQVDTILTQYISLPTLVKEYQKDESGNTINVIYKDMVGKVYTDDEVKELRNIIKKHIVENGAIASLTAANYSQYYNNQNEIMKATAYNCNDSGVFRDHAITIVGWDDNYSKENFAEGAKPSTDGAYIVLNSYGKESFDNGYIYISYEDYLIESELFGIKNSTKKDYNTIYQADFYGGAFAIGTTSTDLGYYANVYKRNESENEFVTDIGVTVFDYVDVEIYINPNNNSMNKESLIKIGENDEILEPGYHRIEVDETKLTGDEFAVVVRQKSANGKFYFAVETPVENTAYACVDSENNSYYSFDGKKWENLANLNVQGFDMKKTDVCIKAFTVEKKEEEKPDEEIPEDEITGDDITEEISVSSEKYLIKNTEIYKIVDGTSVIEFKNNISTESEIKIFDNQNQEIIENNEIIKTGMKLKLDNQKEYTLIVRGDISCDGNVSLVDISRIILHYNETQGFLLTESPLEAADMNCDGNVSLVDVSQILTLYNSK